MIRKIISPLVSGIVVTLIGLTLIGVAIEQCGGGHGAYADGSFGSMKHLGISALVIILILIFNQFRNIYIRMGSITLALVAGYILSYFLGMVDFSSFSNLEYFIIPSPFKYGISFDISFSSYR